MSPEVLRAMQAIAQSLMASRPNEARAIQQWVAAGGNYALPASVFTLAATTAPTVGIPASLIMAAVRNVQGGNAPATEVMQRDQPGQAQAPATGPGTMGYRGAVAGPS